MSSRRRSSSASTRSPQHRVNREHPNQNAERLVLVSYSGEHALLDRYRYRPCVFRCLLFGPVDLGGVDPGGLLALAVLRRPLRRSVPMFDAIHADTAAELALVSSGMTSPFYRAIFSANNTCA